MKHLTVILGAVLFSILVNTKADAQVWVKVKPSHNVVVVKRPAAPAGHVWIEPEWRWRRNAYVYVDGHYVKPKKAHVWVPGHWEEGPQGYRWLRGHWRR